MSTSEVNGTSVVLVPVQLEVMLKDVWAVAEFIKGEQHDLFVDAEALDSRTQRYWFQPALVEANRRPNR